MDNTFKNNHTVIYGYSAIYNYIVTNKNLVSDCKTNEYTYRNIKLILDKHTLSIRIYANDMYSCVASIILTHEDYAIELLQNDIILLSRKEDDITSNMYISIKGINKK